MQEEKAREWEKGTAEPIPFNKYDKVVLKLLSHSFAWVEFHELGGYCQKVYYD